MQSTDLPPIIYLSRAVIDRTARLVIEWDPSVTGRIWIDIGTETKYFYDGEDAQAVWDFYHPENPEAWKSD